MKIKNKIYLIAAGTLLFASCGKSFLTPTPYSSLPAATSITSVSDMGDAVNGMYSAMRSANFLGRDIPVMGDVMSDNVYISGSNSGRYLLENTYSYISTTAEPSNIFTQGYFSILQANRIINSTLTKTSAVNQLRGEAFAARALCYLQLVNWFATPFAVNSAALGVPIVTNTTDITTAFVKPARNSVADVYKQIIMDLDSAYAIMPAGVATGLPHTANSEYISKYAAKALEARAYLYEGDYTNAIAAGLLVVNNGGYSLTTADQLNNYWNNATAITTKVETIFELALNLSTNNGTNGLDYMYNQNGYGDLLCTNDLYNQYTATDGRKGLIITPSPTRGAVLVCNKYQNTTNGADKDDVKIIRYAEVLLTIAEGYARTGDNVNGALYLNMVAKKRDPSFLGYTDIGTALINDIMLERRKELAFEGFRYFDFTRVNAPIQRTTQHPASAQLIPVGDNRRILPIPQAELDANPAMVQNPGY